MGGKGKQPKARLGPELYKQPRANEELARAYRTKPPVWRFARHAKGGQFSWTALSESDLPRVFNALAGYEGMSWQEIEDPRKRPHCHAMGVDRCHREVGEYLAQQGHDIDTLFQLSIGNKGRIFGVRSEHTFEIIFWDVDHLVYKTEKRS